MSAPPVMTPAMNDERDQEPAADAAAVFGSRGLVRDWCGALFVV
ncbi:hypothetical protein [Streptomyces sp. bgisy153]